MTWWRKGRAPGRRARDLFAVLGLTATQALTDDDVRAAWRRVAASTHPDRADGGDPARFAEAAAAYTTLRTRSGRGEALADATAGPARRSGPRLLFATRIRQGRPGRLALRVLAAGVASAAAVAVAGGRPAGPALVTGAVTWLLLTASRDLSPPG